MLKDYIELESKDKHHEIITNVLDGRPGLAPLSHETPLRRILNIRTGTDCWAIEMADEIPEARVIGTYPFLAGPIRNRIPKSQLLHRRRVRDAYETERTVRYRPITRPDWIHQAV